MLMNTYSALFKRAEDESKPFDNPFPFPLSSLLFLRLPSSSGQCLLLQSFVWLLAMVHSPTRDSRNKYPDGVTPNSCLGTETGTDSKNHSHFHLQIPAFAYILRLHP